MKLEFIEGNDGLRIARQLGDYFFIQGDEVETIKLSRDIGEKIWHAMYASSKVLPFRNHPGRIPAELDKFHALVYGSNCHGTSAHLKGEYLPGGGWEKQMTTKTVQALPRLLNLEETIANFGHPIILYSLKKNHSITILCEIKAPDSIEYVVFEKYGSPTSSPFVLKRAKTVDLEDYEYYQPHKKS